MHDDDATPRDCGCGIAMQANAKASHTQSKTTSKRSIKESQYQTS